MKVVTAGPGAQLLPCHGLLLGLQRDVQPLCSSVQALGDVEATMAKWHQAFPITEVNVKAAQLVCVHV